MTSEEESGDEIEISTLRDYKFDQSPFLYFRDQIVTAMRALLPGEPEEVVKEAAEVWWERLVKSQTIDRGKVVSSELEDEIIYRVIMLWNLRDKSRHAGVGPDPNGRLSIPPGLFG